MPTVPTFCVLNGGCPGLVTPACGTALPTPTARCRTAFACHTHLRYLLLPFTLPTHLYVSCSSSGYLYPILPLWALRYRREPQAWRHCQVRAVYNLRHYLVLTAVVLYLVYRPLPALNVDHAVRLIYLPLLTCLVTLREHDFIIQTLPVTFAT